jgi:hypothetical protein
MTVPVMTEKRVNVSAVDRVFSKLCIGIGRRGVAMRYVYLYIREYVSRGGQSRAVMHRIWAGRHNGRGREFGCPALLGAGPGWATNDKINEATS